MVPNPDGGEFLYFQSPKGSYLATFFSLCSVQHRESSAGLSSAGVAVAHLDQLDLWGADCLDRMQEFLPGLVLKPGKPAEFSHRQGYLSILLWALWYLLPLLDKMIFLMENKGGSSCSCQSWQLWCHVCFLCSTDSWNFCVVSSLLASLALVEVAWCVNSLKLSVSGEMITGASYSTVVFVPNFLHK